MGNNVGANGRSVVHQDSGGTTVAFPDVCKTPSPAGPVPIPYPNVAKSSDLAQPAKSVEVEGNPIGVKDSAFSTSTGDEAGTAGGGIFSGKTKGKAEFVTWSFDVKVEGKGVARALDLMTHNDKNTPPVPLVQPPVVGMGNRPEDAVCLCCKKKL
ncbi:DUF4150 domain-containing protein [Pyxidicoccus parkwayensis]|uniref:DUF4150 domain-containing protein n=1 Tax=Pyxidicoccus parkwayensis TaxID=2813578 RepID=A0ABX7NTS4_9BACT|nr:DUF4150 domain-containing protein [Pyxidicoccus parkwaysis]QSQ22272.1 DUF4150 domain-containing protein [Pyxidicoccus parkwaysis]